MDFDLFFASENVVYNSGVVPGILKRPAYFLFNHAGNVWSAVFLAFTALAAIYLIFSRFATRMVAFVLWFLVLNINNQAYAALNGGDYLLQQLLFFNIFISTGKSRFPDLDIALHNFGVLALKCQVCLVYFIAGYTKLLDADWQSGNALAYIFHVKDFSEPFLYKAGNSVLLKTVSYAVIAYQLLFPFLIWIRKIKVPLIALGILQHLIIAFVLGLPSFGLIMIIAYSIFYFPGRDKHNGIS